jgi:glycosyltransferase involved in cell wall biosynthesis
VTVTGSVPDVRPYLAGAWAVVAPLRIARGIQNKVLEALAMDKPVLASPSVCRTFGPDLPVGIVCCDSPEDYRRALASPGQTGRRAARERFSWTANVDRLADEVAGCLAAPGIFPGQDDSLGQNPEVPRCASSARSSYPIAFKRS